MNPLRWFALSIPLALAGCDSTFETPIEPDPPSLDVALRAAIGGWGTVPIGPMPDQNPAQVELGRMLFFDKVLSGNRDVACSSCHSVGAALGDGSALSVGTGRTDAAGRTSLGPGRQFTPRGAPSLLNAGIGLQYLFWDGRVEGGRGFLSSIDRTLNLPTGFDHNLALQAMLPVLNRREMRGEPGDRDVFGAVNELAQLGDHQQTEIWAALVKRLTAIAEYQQLFNAAYPGGATLGFDRAAKALAAFQLASFVKTRSPFDRYLDRYDFALTTEQKRGGLLFFGRARCSQCHNGPFLGATGFANVGAPQIGPGGKQQPPRDLGRGEHDPNYRLSFRIAPLRNVELTAPYFHSGAFNTLDQVVHHYNNVRRSVQEYDPSHLDPAVRSQYRGDAGTIADLLENLHPALNDTLGLSRGDEADLVAFLKSLTDSAARNLQSLAPARVPSGLPVTP